MKKYFDLLNLPDASDFYCAISGLRRAVLTIDILDSRDVHRYSAMFSSIAYMRCPSRWEGARFRMANTEEQEQFLSFLPERTKGQWERKNQELSKHYYDFRSIFILDPEKSTRPLIPIMIVAEKAVAFEIEEK